MKVNHKAFGTGTIEEIANGKIKVNFENATKVFVFPDAFESFLTTDDAELLQRIEKEKAEKKEREEAIQKAKVEEMKRKIAVEKAQKREDIIHGDRAQTIEVCSENEMFEMIGYMAKPNRISSIEAEIPCDGREKTFERMFPNQTYRPIAISETPSGMPSKLNPQYRINFADTENCVPLLKDNMRKGHGNHGGRINKSEFVFDLVENYGFRFGKEQNVSDIRAIAERRGYLEDFERGLHR